DASVQLLQDDMLSTGGAREPRSVIWDSVLRRGTNARPSDRPNLVYPVAIDPDKLAIVGTGRTLKDRIDAGEVIGDVDSWLPDPDETWNGYPVTWPIRTD